jgi:hypothetical protein
MVFFPHMRMTRQQWLIAGIGLAAVAALGWLWRAGTRAPAPAESLAPLMLPQSAATTTSATTTVSPVSPSPVAKPFPINPADTIVAWSFKGAYTGNDTLLAKANADIAHLKSLIGKGQYDDYDLFIGLGNDADLMGDGALAYQNYNRAASIRPDKGLAYANLAHLMDELGAYRTAADAYAKAVAVEPIQQYKNAQADYLRWRFPEQAQ